jgi:tetratricopeptide (TPR) repeat protein
MPTGKSHIMSRIPVALFCVGLLLLISGCGRAGYLDEKERENVIVAKAQEMIDMGEYDKAITLFRKALDLYPEFARPHLDLALVLHDRKKDYVRAMYHYNRYLELRPSTDKNDMIEARMRQAERAFVASRVTVNGADGPSAMQLLEENSRLQERVEALEKTVTEQEKELNALREEERRRLRDQVITGGETAPTGSVSDVSVVAPPAADPEVLDREALEPASPALTVPSISVEPVARPVVPATSNASGLIPSVPLPTVATSETNRGDVLATFRTYTVQRGDSLSRIAFKVYGDATRWRGIQEANRDVLGDSVNVRVGQVLKIP